MKKTISFSKFFFPAAIISISITILGVFGFIYHNGFNLGIDFQAGLIQEVQFAPTAFSLTYNGPGNASIYLSRTNIDVVISGAGIDEITHSFSFNSYPNQAALVRGLTAVEGITVLETAPSGISSSWLVQSAQSSPLLDANNPFSFHYLPPDASPVPLEEVRASLFSLGTVSVQELGVPAERRFMIRMEDRDLESTVSGSLQADMIIRTLESSFGQGSVTVTRSDYVGSRFSKNLTDQAGILVGLTLLLILLYTSIRFKLQYALGAVIGILNDAIVIVAFVLWTRMEFNTTTIAAILTILGYSINNTIVVFDRVRENFRIFPYDNFTAVINRSLTETLNRTLITTLTTIFAVLALFLFTSGSMKDFALAIIVGLVSGVYTSLFIATGIVHLWEKKKHGKKEDIEAPVKLKAPFPKEA